MPAMAGAGPGPTSGAGKPIQIPHAVGRSPIISAITAVAEGLNYQKAQVRRRNQEWNPVWGAGILTTRLKCPLLFGSF